MEKRARGLYLTLIFNSLRLHDPEMALLCSTLAEASDFLLVQQTGILQGEEMMVNE